MEFYYITLIISITFFLELISDDPCSWYLWVSGIITAVSIVVVFFDNLLTKKHMRVFHEKTHSTKVDYYISERYLSKKYQAYEEYLGHATNINNQACFIENTNKAISSAAKSHLLKTEPIDWFYYLTVFQSDIFKQPQIYNEKKVSLYLFLAYDDTFSHIPVFPDAQIFNYQTDKRFKKYDTYKTNIEFFTHLEKPYLTDVIEFDFNCNDFIYSELSTEKDRRHGCNLPIFVKVSGTLEFESKFDKFLIKNCTFTRADYSQHIKKIETHIYDEK